MFGILLQESQFTFIDNGIDDDEYATNLEKNAFLHALD